MFYKDLVTSLSMDRSAVYSPTEAALSLSLSLSLSRWSELAAKHDRNLELRGFRVALLLLLLQLRVCFYLCCKHLGNRWVLQSLYRLGLQLRYFLILKVWAMNLASVKG